MSNFQSLGKQMLSKKQSLRLQRAAKNREHLTFLGDKWEEGATTKCTRSKGTMSTVIKLQS